MHPMSPNRSRVGRRPAPALNGFGSIVSDPAGAFRSFVGPRESFASDAIIEVLPVPPSKVTIFAHPLRANLARLANNRIGVQR